MEAQKIVLKMILGHSEVEFSWEYISKKKSQVCWATAQQGGEKVRCT